MKNKFIILLMLIIVLAFVVIEYSEMQYFKEQIIEVSIDKFKPYSENNLLKKYETSIQLQEELPVIEAASTFYPFAANLVQNIYSEELYSEELLKMASTNQVYNDIIYGNADIIIVTNPSEQQEKLIRESGNSLEYKELYMEPLVIFTNINNKINSLTIEQLKEIYTKTNFNWNTYQLKKNNGSQTCFESIVKDNKIEFNHYELNTMPQIIDEVGFDKKGIGYAFHSYYSKMHINKNTKIIDIDNKKINDKEYPLLFKVYLIYKSDNNNPNISKIVNWLETEEGKFIVNNIK